MKLKFNGEFENELFLGKDKYLLKKGCVVDVDEKELESDKGLFKFFLNNGTLEAVEEVEVSEVAEEVEAVEELEVKEPKKSKKGKK